MHFALVDGNHAVIAETAQHAAGRFRRHAQVVGDLHPAHAQVEAQRRKTTPCIALGQVQQERGHARLGAMVGRHQRHLADLGAEQAEQLGLEAGHARGQQAHAREREPAQVHRIQRNGVAGVARTVDRVEPDHLARQAEAQHLLVALAVVEVGLDHAAPHRGDRIEGIARAEDVLARAERAHVVHQHMQVGQRGLVVALRHARIGKRAGAAETQRIAVIGGSGVGGARRRHDGGDQDWASAKSRPAHTAATCASLHSCGLVRGLSGYTSVVVA